MFSSIKAFFNPKVSPTQVVKTWKTGMWVMKETRVGILFNIDSLCEVHFVDSITSETISVERVPLTALRQAKLLEIPAIRRPSPDIAEGLGYGT